MKIIVAGWNEKIPNKSFLRATKKVKPIGIKVKTLGLNNATLTKKVQRSKDKVDTSQTKQNDSKIAAVSSTNNQNKSRGKQ